MKQNIYLFFLYVLNTFLLKIPSHTIRIQLLRFFGVKMGSSNFIRLNCIFIQPKGIIIGDCCSINQEVMLDGRGGLLKIGNNVDIGYQTNIWTLEHDPHSDNHDVRPGDVLIEDYVWIASRVTILPGVSIGRGAVIAAGSIVTKNVAEMSIVAGIPAKEIGKRKSALLYNPSKFYPFR